MAKVILTEEQLNEIAITQMLANLFRRGVSRLMLKKCLALGISASALLFALNVARISNAKKQQLKNYVAQSVQQKPDSMKVDAVKQYIAYALKNQGYNTQMLKLTPEKMVALADRYNYDLPLLLAQAHLESCFGMTPRAQKTNSVFSVGCYDDGRNVVPYSNQDESVEGYIRLMRSDYLGNNKTHTDLLTPGAFVNKNGHRYAQDQNYEAKVNNIRNRIIRMFPVLVK